MILDVCRIANKCHQCKYNISEIESWERPRIAGIKKVKAFKDGAIIFD